MYYYNFRYNIYPTNAAPVELEEWIRNHGELHEDAVKVSLAARHDTEISIIQFREVCAEAFARQVIKENAGHTFTWAGSSIENIKTLPGGRDPLAVY